MRHDLAVDTDPRREASPAPRSPVTIPVRHQKEPHASWFALTLAAIAIHCSAADSVRLTYNAGYPLPGKSMETTEVMVTRPSTWPGSRADIDKYFNAVSDVLTQLEQQPNCGSMPIHAPTVTLHIVLGSKVFTRVCAFEVSGVPLQLDSSPLELAHTHAFERLVKLTVERSNAMLRR